MAITASLTPAHEVAADWLVVLVSDAPELRETCVSSTML